MAGPLRWLQDVEAGFARHVFRAWLVALLPGLALLVLRVGLAGAWRVPASARPDPLLLVWSIFGAPVVETLALQGIAFLLARAGVGVAAQILSLTTLGALAHAVGGSWWNALFAAWPFFVYSTVLCAWRTRSERLAFAATALVHALYNAALVGLMGLALVTAR